MHASRFSQLPFGSMILLKITGILIIIIIIIIMIIIIIIVITINNDDNNFLPLQAHQEAIELLKSIGVESTE